MTPGFWYLPRVDMRRLGNLPRRSERGEFLGRCAALERQGEALVVVPGLPVSEGCGRRADVPAHGVWIVIAASGAQIAGTVNVRQGTVAIASPRPRACQVP